MKLSILGTLLFFLFLTGCSSNKVECTIQNDCPGKKCIAGKCVWTNSCQNELHDYCKPHEMCHQDRCIPSCATEFDCPPNHACSLGVCHAFSFTKTAPKPNQGATVQTALQAGVAEGYLEVPVGVSQGGYGFRPGILLKPYSQSIAASQGMFHRLKAKVIVLDNGIERIVIVSLPMIFVTDWLKEMVTRKMIEDDNLNYRNNLIMTASHTHSGPGRIWLINTVGFGAFGLDEYMDEIHQRIANSIAKTISQAVANLQPASYGYKVNTQFDPQRRITHHRRGEIPEIMDNRLVAIRIDDATGKPLAVIVNFGTHGTVHEREYLTGDAPAGTEFGLENALEAAHGRRVPVLFINGHGGSVSPGCNSGKLSNTQSMWRCGKRSIEQILPVINDITTSSNIDMSIISQRIPITRENIGYTKDEFYDANPLMGGDEYSPYLYGAFQCGLNVAAADIPMQDGKLGCLLNIEYLFRTPVTIFSKTVITAAKIGGLAIYTVPGEPHMDLGVEILRRLETELGWADVMPAGYSQDHQLYISRENDWVYGGYETTMSVWGPKFGNFIIDQIVANARRLVVPGPDAFQGRVLPQDFIFTDDEKKWVPYTVTPEARAGVFITDAPAKVKRLEQALLTWVGGHPGVGTPMIVLQKKTGGTFKDLSTLGEEYSAGKSPYDNASLKIITRYLKVEVQTDKFEHHWSLVWGEKRNFPTGTYRFRIHLPYWDGSQTKTKEIHSAAFELSLCDTMQVKVRQATLAGLTAEIAYPMGPAWYREKSSKETIDVDLDNNQANESKVKLDEEAYAGGIQLNHPDCPGMAACPPQEAVKVTTTSVSQPSVSEQVAQANITEETKNLPIPQHRGKVTESTLPGKVGTSYVRTRTESGPVGVITVQYANPLPTVGEYTVRVEDAFGNFGEITATVTP